MNKAVVYAQSKNVRISPKKVRPVMDVVRGKNALIATTELKFNKTKAAKLILKVLNSAIANAKNNLDLKPENLYISDLQANEGIFRKDARIVAMSRVSTLLKRSTHIIVGLSERNTDGK